MSDTTEQGPSPGSPTDPSAYVVGSNGFTESFGGSSVSPEIRQQAQACISKLMNSIRSSVEQLKKLDSRHVARVYDNDPTLSELGARVNSDRGVTLRWTDPVASSLATVAVGIVNSVLAPSVMSAIPYLVVWGLHGVSCTRFLQNVGDNVSLSATDYLRMAERVCEDWDAETQGEPVPSLENIGPITLLSGKALKSVMDRRAGTQQSTSGSGTAGASGGFSLFLLSELDSDLKKLVRETEAMLETGIDPVKEE